MARDQQLSCYGIAYLSKTLCLPALINEIWIRASWYSLKNVCLDSCCLVQIWVAPFDWIGVHIIILNCKPQTAQIIKLLYFTYTLVKGLFYRSLAVKVDFPERRYYTV